MNTVESVLAFIPALIAGLATVVAGYVVMSMAIALLGSLLAALVAVCAGVYVAKRVMHADYTGIAQSLVGRARGLFAR